MKCLCRDIGIVRIGEMRARYHDEVQLALLDRCVGDLRISVNGSNRDGMIRLSLCVRRRRDRPANPDGR